MTSIQTSFDNKNYPKLKKKKKSSCTIITTMAGKSGSEIFNIVADLTIKLYSINNMDYSVSFI
jgi:hypothetical protein